MSTRCHGFITSRAGSAPRSELQTIISAPGARRTSATCARRPATPGRRAAVRAARPQGAVGERRRPPAAAEEQEDVAAAALDHPAVGGEEQAVEGTAGLGAAHAVVVDDAQRRLVAGPRAQRERLGFDGTSSAAASTAALAKSSPALPDKPPPGRPEGDRRGSGSRPLPVSNGDPRAPLPRFWQQRCGAARSRR